MNENKITHYKWDLRNQHDRFSAKARKHEDQVGTWGRPRQCAEHVDSCHEKNQWSRVVFTYQMWLNSSGSWSSTVGGIRLKPSRYLAHYLADLKLRLEFGRKRSCLNFVPFRTIGAPCYTYSNARKAGRHVFLVTIVQSISHHLSQQNFIYLVLFG